MAVKALNFRWKMAFRRGPDRRRSRLPFCPHFIKSYQTITTAKAGVAIRRRFTMKGLGSGHFMSADPLTTFFVVGGAVLTAISAILVSEAEVEKKLGPLAADRQCRTAARHDGGGGRADRRRTAATARGSLCRNHPGPV